MQARNLAAALQAALILGLLPSGCDDSPSRPDPVRFHEELGEPTDPDGPILTLVSSNAGAWTGGTPDPRDFFAGGGTRFWWSAEPGANGAAIAGYSYAVDDTTDWSPLSLDDVEWPPQTGGEEQLWYPSPGLHALFVRAIDEDGLVSVAAGHLAVITGPDVCWPPWELHIVVVMDGIPFSEEGGAVRNRVDSWLHGYDYDVWETDGTNPVEAPFLGCASTVVWFHGADVAAGEKSVLQQYHETNTNLLVAFQAAGGNVFLVGVRPSEAMRYMMPEGGLAPEWQDYPLDLENASAAYLPHWLRARGVSGIEGTVGDPMHGSVDRGIKRATSLITTGHAYPDLVADPAALPPGASGFGYFDRGITVIAGSGAEVIYVADDTGIPIGMRRLTTPGPAGNFAYLGIDPWRVNAGQFGELVDAVLTDFGETPLP